MADVPVLLISVRGVESDGFDQLVTLLGTAGANYRGTLWFDAQLAKESDGGTAPELARALGLGEGANAAVLRGLALSRIAGELQTSVATPTGIDGGPPSPAVFPTLTALRTAGFLDYDAPDGAPDDLATVAPPGTRFVVVGGATASVPDAELA